MDKNITDPRKVSEELINSYGSLYRRTSVKTEGECLQYLEKLSTLMLTLDEQSICECKLTLQEHWEARASMQNGKSPGNDSFITEFYVVVFGELEKLLVSVFNYAFEVGELSSFQKHAVITLIQKKDRDNMLVENWRPISLIIVDIKIASKALAFRPRKVIHKVIHYVKGRYIGESVGMIDDLLAYAESENLDGILFATDIEKAFDSVEHNFIFAPLKKFGYGEDFIRWFKAFMTLRAV